MEAGNGYDDLGGVGSLGRMENGEEVGESIGLE